MAEALPISFPKSFTMKPFPSRTFTGLVFGPDTYNLVCPFSTIGFRPIIPPSIKLQNLDEIALQIFWAVSGETALQST
jgi:hypothetical protein